MTVMDKTCGCVKNTIRLRSGRYFDFIDPKPDQFTLEDIAGALSKICRFGGQANNFYSVAEHSWHCAVQANEDGLSLESQRACLMHDAAEAFCGDVVKPLKIMLRGYSEIEARVEAVIGAKFSIDFQREAEVVREIDHAMLIAERREMFSKDNVEWVGENEVRRLKRVFGCFAPDMAEWAFMLRARALGLGASA